MSDGFTDQDLLFFNGVDGDSGEYSLPPMTGEDLSGFIQGDKPPENLAELKYRYQQDTSETFGVKEGVDPKKLDETGWGVIYSQNTDPAVKEALSELVNFRREQSGEYFKLYDGPDGYRPDESKSDFLARHGAGPGPADPKKVPYYLLLVGSPSDIPYRFQSQLDVQYAVGRIHFDSLDEYASYAQSVVASESGSVKLSRQATFFGVANPGDTATQMSADNLIAPLSEEFSAWKEDWTFNTYLREKATKAQLGNLLGGDQTPSLLFTASHGMSFPLGSDRQINHQGALLCQDWPGPKEWRGKGEIPQDFYFAGDDLSSDARVLGLMAFFFACYGASTPLYDEFSKQAFKQRDAIAPHPFVAQLPSKLLGHPKGGALAAIGHVERAWGYSFLWPKAGTQTVVFESTLKRLFEGHPVGSAIEYFNERYAELSTVLSDLLEDIEFGKKVNPYELAGLWTANNDARGFTVLGDPAVRLPLAVEGEEAERPEIITVSKERSEPKKLKGTEVGPETTEQGPEPVVTSDPSETVQPVFAGKEPSAGAFADAAALDYGFLSALSETRTRLNTTVNQFADNLGRSLGKAVDEAATLKVSTYVSQDMEAADKNLSENASLQVITEIKIAGDTRVVVREDDGKIDADLWKVHRDMVELAQANRIEMIKAAAEAISGLLQSMKVI